MLVADRCDSSRSSASTSRLMHGRIAARFGRETSLEQDISWQPQSEKKTMRRTMWCQGRTLERSGSLCHIHQELYGSKKLQGSSSSQSRALHQRGIVPRWQATSSEEQWIRVDSHHIRRPQPKPKGILSSVRDPSSLRNLSGLNSLGLWYFFSSCVIALKIESVICLERPSRLSICLQSRPHLVIWVMSDLR